VAKKDEEEPSTREILMGALEAAVKAYDAYLDEWDIYTVKDFAATLILEGDYSESFTVRIKEPMPKVERDEQS
jgi:hypothetical protein